MHPRARPRLLLLAAAAPLLLAACATTSDAGTASDYPTKAVTWVVPYAAGGNTDSISRTVAEAMGKQLGQDIVVLNKPGGSGAIGMQEIQQAKPDGYTIGLFTTGTIVVAPLVNNLDYSHESFTNIGLMLTQPVLFMTTPDSKYQTMADLVAAAKANPKKISIGVPGAGTPQAYEINRMERDYGTAFTIVPFNSNAEIITALRGGNLDAVALNASKDVESQVKAGDLRALAVGEAERLEWLPDTPTLKELGFDTLTISGTLIGVTAPAGLPDGVRRVLEEALKAALQDAKVQEFLGAHNVPDEFVGSSTVTELLKERRDVYQELIAK